MVAGPLSNLANLWTGSSLSVPVCWLTMRRHLPSTLRCADGLIGGNCRRDASKAGARDESARPSRHRRSSFVDVTSAGGLCPPIRQLLPCGLTPGREKDFTNGFDGTQKRRGPKIIIFPPSLSSSLINCLFPTFACPRPEPPAHYHSHRALPQK